MESGKKIGDWNFKHVCQLVPEPGPDGKPAELFPQSRYGNPKNLPLHKHGAGPFCKFAIDGGYAEKSGVYAIVSDDIVQYVEECEDLHGRFNAGFGNISPRNCFFGGQSTNCRINSHILERHKSGARIRLYFLETEDWDDMFHIKDSLICGLRPPWNKIAGRPLE